MNIGALGITITQPRNFESIHSHLQITIKTVVKFCRMICWIITPLENIKQAANEDTWWECRTESRWYPHWYHNCSYIQLDETRVSVSEIKFNKADGNSTNTVAEIQLHFWLKCSIIRSSVASIQTRVVTVLSTHCMNLVSPNFTKELSDNIKNFTTKKKNIGGILHDRLQCVTECPIHSKMDISQIKCSSQYLYARNDSKLQIE